MSWFAGMQVAVENSGLLIVRWRRECIVREIDRSWG
jgi:hypothetical protein